MQRFIPPAVKAFVQQAQGIPGSFKDVFVETRNVLALRRKRSVPGVRLSRREELLIDTNSNSLSYLAAFFVAQAVPILGWFPLAIALRFPRQLLTSHFHSVEQMNDFLKEEYKERTENSLELRDHIVRTYAPIHPRLFLAGGPLESMSSLSSKHVKLLAGATSLHHGNIMNQRLFPSMLDKRMLESMATAIMKDDGFLRSEGLDKCDLTQREMQLALIRRGFNPLVVPKSQVFSDAVTSGGGGGSHSSSESTKVHSGDKVGMESTTTSSSTSTALINQGKIALTSWSQIYDTVTPVAIQSNGKTITLAPPSHSYILHASCLPELLPELSPWRQSEMQRQQQQRNTIATSSTAKSTK